MGAYGAFNHQFYHDHRYLIDFFCAGKDRQFLILFYHLSSISTMKLDGCRSLYYTDTLTKSIFNALSIGSGPVRGGGLTVYVNKASI